MNEICDRLNTYLSRFHSRVLGFMKIMGLFIQISYLCSRSAFWSMAKGQG